MPVPYSSVAIANYFIERFAGSEGIVHMKLQKLVYCSYGWWLATKGLDAPRLTSDSPEVWKYGPIFDRIYHVFKYYGGDPITKAKSVGPFDEPENIDDGDKEVQKFLGWIWDRFGQLSAYSLSELMHEEGSPWHRTAADHDFRVKRNQKVSDEYILEEYGGLLRKSNGEADGIREMA